MDVVLVGLSGSGKTDVARMVAQRTGAELVDLDAEVERSAGRSIAAIFADDGEAAFRALEGAAVRRQPPPSPGPGIERVIATGGGAVIGPEQRWRLYRGRHVLWLDAPSEVLAARAAAIPGARPLLAADPVAALERLRGARGAWYAAADARIDASPALPDVVEAVLRAAAALEHPADDGFASGVLLRAGSPLGRLIVGDGIAAREIEAELRRLDVRRALVVTEPGARRSVGDGLVADLRGRGWPVAIEELPMGEAAKSLGAVGHLVERLVGLGLERGEPIVAVGGGALTDAAGFAAAISLRGVPWLAVPTTLAGQVDAAIGGKTGVNLAAGKNLAGAFHPPIATIADVATLATLPERDRRAALAEAAKVAFLGEAALLELLEAAGPAIARADASDGAEAELARQATAELVERAALFKLALVVEDPEEHGPRIALNLGHTLGHALEAATGYGTLLHGEAVAYGLRLAARLGAARRTVGSAHVARLERLLDRLDLATEPLDVDPATVLARITSDKKRRAGRIRWVLPTDDGWMTDDAIPAELVATLLDGILAGRAGTAALAGAR